MWTRLKGRDCRWEVRGSRLRFQLQTAIFHVGSQAKVLPNDGRNAFIKQNMNPRVYCCWREPRKEQWDLVIIFFVCNNRARGRGVTNMR